MINTDYAAGHHAGATSMRWDCMNLLRNSAKKARAVGETMRAADCEMHATDIEMLPLPAPTEPVTQDELGAGAAAIRASAENALEWFRRYKEIQDVLRPFAEYAKYVSVSDCLEDGIFAYAVKAQITYSDFQMAAKVIDAPMPTLAATDAAAREGGGHV